MLGRLLVFTGFASLPRALIADAIAAGPARNPDVGSLYQRARPATRNTRSITMPSLFQQHNDSLAAAGISVMAGYFLAAVVLLGQYLGGL
jgi:hypothetical protein